MMTGRLVQCKGSLARAALPFVFHLKWGWHRVERAMERGKFSLDDLFDRADTWCVANLPVEPVQLGVHKREVVAVDSSTIARWRATARTALLGKGSWHRAGRAVRANIVAAATRVVWIAGVRVGLVQRVRFGASCEEAVAAVFADLPPSAVPRLLAVDAGIATQKQFAAATARDALTGRLRINCKLRGAPPPRPPSQRGRPPTYGAVLHPGAAQPEVVSDEDFTRPGEKGEVRVRRNTLHFEEDHTTILDVVRINDPAYPRPLLIGSTATELTTAESEQAYGHRWPVETNFFVAQDTAAMEMPRAWTARAGAADRVRPAGRGGVESDGGGVRPARDRALGPQAGALGGALGPLLGPPRVEFRRPFPARGSSTKLPQNSKVVSYQGLTGQRGSLNW